MTDKVANLAIELSLQNEQFIKAIGQASKRLDELGTHTKKASQSVGGLEKSFENMKRAAVAAGAAFAALKGFDVFLKGAEQIENLQGSFKALLGDSGRAADMLDRVFQIVGNTGADVGQASEAVQRLSIGLKEMGASNAQIQAIAENFIKLGRVSGSSMADINGALLQFTQGLSSGKLQGDELRSIMERVPMVVQLIAKEMGVTTGEVKALGAEGKITADIMANAMLGAGQDISDKFAELPKTFDQNMNILKASWLQFTADVGKTSGIIDDMGKAFKYVNDMMSDASAKTGAINVVAGVLKTTFQTVAVVASDLVFMIRMVASDIARIGDIGGAIAKGDFGKIPGIWREYTAAQKKAREELDKFQASMMGTAAPAEAVADATKKTTENLGRLTSVTKPTAAELKKVADAMERARKEELDFENALQASTFGVLQENIKRHQERAAVLERVRQEELDFENVLQASTFGVLQENIKRHQERAEALKAEGDAVRASVDPYYVYNQEIEKLNRLLAEGAISWEVYADATFKAQDGLATFATSSKPELTEMQKNIQRIATDGLGGLIDSIFAAKRSFSDFARDFLKQIAAMIAKQMLLNALKKSSFGGLLGLAHGGAFGGATGLPYGIYNQPTYFDMPGTGPLKKYAKGGVLGEAGPEAILPLSRNSSGDLGVKAEAIAPVVNIYNNTGASVRTEQKGNEIEVIIGEISRQINRGIGPVGAAFENRYAMRKA